MVIYRERFSMQLKKIIQITPLLFFASFACYTIIWGEHGLLHYNTLKNKINRDQQKIEHLYDSIKNLKVAIKHYEKVPFFSEKTARCDLTLGYTNEVVYLLPETTKLKA